MLTEPGPVASPRLSRRTVLVGALAVPFIAAGCRNASTTGERTTPGEFTVRHDGADVRCLFHDRLLAGDRPGCLVMVLLHGASADVSQWFDIGVVAAVDGLALGPAVHRVVTVAPDLVDHEHAAGLVIDTLLPHLDRRFAPGMYAISGISRGALVALDVARDSNTKMVSVGLHSPALRLTAPIEPVSWPAFIDVGDDDSLADATTRTASLLRESGIEVTEHHWPGGHDRTYWRRHLPDYLAFHADAAQRSAS